MRVLVTGHQGYIGTRLVTLLKAAGVDLAGMDSGLFRDCAIFPLDEIPTVTKDIREVEFADLQGFDAVLHLAGLSNDPLGDIHPAMTYQINFEATVRLAELAKRAGVRRFIYASSCSVYGAAGDHIVDETGPFNPVTPYGSSKALSEAELTRLADSTFSPVFLRAATAYGVSPMIRFDLVVNNLVAWATATSRVHIKSDGTPWRPVVHVEDIARAYVAMLKAPTETVHLQAFNVGVQAENYQVRELAEFVRDAVPGAVIEYALDAGPDKRCYRVDFGKIQRLLPEFRPCWTARKGAAEIYEAIRLIGLRKSDFEGARYNRVDHLKLLARQGRIDDEMRLVEPIGPVSTRPSRPLHPSVLPV